MSTPFCQHREMPTKTSFFLKNITVSSENGSQKLSPWRMAIYLGRGQANCKLDQLPVKKNIPAASYHSQPPHLYEGVLPVVNFPKALEADFRLKNCDDLMKIITFPLSYNEAASI